MPRGRVARVAGLVVAVGMLASCTAEPGASPAGTGTGPGAAGAAAAGPCSASAGGGVRMPMLPQPGSMVVSYQLSGVAAMSAGSVWAVGTTDSTDPRAMHWNGRTWTEQALPLSPGQPGNPPGTFQAVAEVSAGDVWAVGGTTGNPLAEHWDGTAWTVIPTPSPSPRVTSTSLQGIAAVSARDIWAVGGSGQPLILHWDGRAWTQVPGPAPAGADTGLYGVAAVSAVSVWAVGNTWPIGGTQAPLIEHWNGTAWTAVPGPAIPDGAILTAVAASSPRNAWAVGTKGTRTGGDDAGSGLIEHWDGRTWTIVPSPDLGAGADGGGLHGGGGLNAVTIAPDGSAWAVGEAYCPRHGILTVTEHWDGRTWVLVPSPAYGELDAVAAASPTSAWAVGYWSSSSTAIIEHWNGTAWTWPSGFCAAPSGPGCYLPSTDSSSP